MSSAEPVYLKRVQVNSTYDAIFQVFISKGNHNFELYLVRDMKELLISRPSESAFRLLVQPLFLHAFRQGRPESLKNDISYLFIDLGITSPDGSRSARRRVNVLQLKLQLHKVANKHSSTWRVLNECSEPRWLSARFWTTPRVTEGG